MSECYRPHQNISMNISPRAELDVRLIRKPEHCTQYQWCFCWIILEFHIQNVPIPSFLPPFFEPLAILTLDWQLELESRELAGQLSHHTAGASLARGQKNNDACAQVNLATNGQSVPYLFPVIIIFTFFYVFDH